jgi:hypothetical protein
MKRFLSLGTAAVFAAALTTSALANGQGSPVEPAPMPAPTQLEPAGPAPAATVEKTQSSQNWWLIALAAVIIIAIIVIASDDDDDNNNTQPG